MQVVKAIRWSLAQYFVWCVPNPVYVISFDAPVCVPMALQLPDTTSSGGAAIDPPETTLTAPTPGAVPATTRASLLRAVLRVVAPAVNAEHSPPEDLTDVHGLCIDRDTLLDPSLTAKLVQHRDALKQAYHTSALSCLHQNSTQKQRAPGVCLVRQLLKANGLRLAPRVQSMGYDKATGKKRVRRYYEVEEG